MNMHRFGTLFSGKIDCLVQTLSVVTELMLGILAHVYLDLVFWQIVVYECEYA